MVARDRVKTMVSRAHSIIDGHPELKQRRATQYFWLTKSHNPHPSWLMRLLSIVKFLLYDVWTPAYLLEYISVANHDFLEEGDLFGFYIDTHQVNGSNDLQLH